MDKKIGCVRFVPTDNEYWWKDWSSNDVYLREIFAEAAEDLEKGHSGLYNFLAYECLFYEKNAPGETRVDIPSVKDWIKKYKDAPFARIILDFGPIRGQNIVFYYFKCDACELGAFQASLPKFIVNNPLCANALPLYA